MTTMNNPINVFLVFLFLVVCILIVIIYERRITKVKNDAEVDSDAVTIQHVFDFISRNKSNEDLLYEVFEMRDANKIWEFVPVNILIERYKNYMKKLNNEINIGDAVITYDMMGIVLAKNGNELTIMEIKEISSHKVNKYQQCLTAEESMILNKIIDTLDEFENEEFEF